MGGFIGGFKMPTYVDPMGMVGWQRKKRLQDMIAAAAEDPQESYEQLLDLSVVAACATRGLKVPGMW